jgi:hypothetical protein
LKRDLQCIGRVTGYSIPIIAADNNMAVARDDANPRNLVRILVNHIVQDRTQIGGLLDLH